MKTIKSLFFPLLMISFLFSCSKKNTENEQLVKQYFDLFNAHKWEELSELYIENAEFRDPSLGQKVIKQSKAEFVKRYSELGQICPDIKDKITKIYPSGNNIIVEFVSTGSAPDNSKFELPICTIFTIENGKITKDFTYYDNFEETK